MTFKNYNYYDELLNNIQFLNLIEFQSFQIFDYKAQKKYPLKDISFAYILDYIITVKQIKTFNYNSKKESNSVISCETYEQLCRFFNQDPSKVTLKNLFECFELDKSYFNEESFKNFTFAFSNLQKKQENEYLL